MKPTSSRNSVKKRCSSGRPSSEILIVDRAGMVRLSKAKIRRWARRVLETLGRQKVVLSLVFVNDRQMRKLHRKFLGKNRATDVLAFGQNEGKFVSSGRKSLLGDIVLSVETAKRRAPEFGNRWDRELLLYLIHGILHLMGFRDSAPTEKIKMRAMEEEILTKLLGNSWQSKKPKLLF